MKPLAFSLALALMLISGAERVTAASPCGERDEQAYQRKAALPRGAAEALGVAMAEKGEPYQMGDVVLHKGLPLYCFVSATRSRCRIEITYEQGGFAHLSGTFSVSLVGGVSDWVKRPLSIE